MSQPYNEYAFPQEDHNGDKWPGMTVRDYFAAKAMQGTILGMGAEMELVNPPQLARWAYKMADAMLEERSKQS